MILCISSTFYKSGTVFNKLDVYTKIEIKHRATGKTITLDSEDDLKQVIAYLRGFSCQNNLSSNIEDYWIAVKFYHDDTQIGTCTLFNNDDYHFN